MRELFDFTGRRVWVAGHAGMVGSAVVRRLAREGCEILTVGRKDLDLRRQSMVEDWMEANRPDAVVLAAGRVGGIVANSSLPGDFIYDNLAIAANVIHAARGCGVTRLLYLGSSCIYPKLAEQPMTEGALLTGPLEPSNEWYAVAKIAGVKLCQAYRLQHGCDFIAAMPTNLYGPGDNFDPVNSHVVPGLMARIDRALAEGADGVRIWGSGTPRRDFLHVDDLADAAVFLLRHYSGDLPVNIGTGQDVSVLELAEMLAQTIGWRGRFDFDPSKPDGAPRKVLDAGVLKSLGWTSGMPLRDGLAATYRWYRQAGAENVRGGAQVSR